MFASLPHVCGGQGGGTDELSAEEKGNRKKKPLVTAAVTLAVYKPRPGITDFLKAVNQLPFLIGKWL